MKLFLCGEAKMYSYHMVDLGLNKHFDLMKSYFEIKMFQLYK